MTKTTLMVTVSAVISYAMLPLCCTANAEQSSPKSSSAHATPTKSFAPYSIALLLGNGWDTSYTGLPKMTVNFINSSPYTLNFVLTSSFSSFTVEYKAARGNVASGTDWKMLQFGFQPPPDAGPPGRPTVTQTFAVIGNILSKQQWQSEYDLLGFPMSAEGFYRITAVVNIPNVAELAGPVSSPTVIRKFDLNLRSNSVIVRRTAGGFVAVDPKAASQTAPK